MLNDTSVLSALHVYYYTLLDVIPLRSSYPMPLRNACIHTCITPMHTFGLAQGMETILAE